MLTMAHVKVGHDPFGRYMGDSLHSEQQQGERSKLAPESVEGRWLI